MIFGRSQKSEPESPEEALARNARDAADFLKALGHEGRLLLLCHLAAGEKTVTELEHLIDSRQAAVSQQLARLRLEGMVASRREGKTIIYSLSDERTRRMLEVVYDMFCKADEDRLQAENSRRAAE